MSAQVPNPWSQQHCNSNNQSYYAILFTCFSFSTKQTKHRKSIIPHLYDWHRGNGS